MPKKIISCCLLFLMTLLLISFPVAAKEEYDGYYKNREVIETE